MLRHHRVRSGSHEEFHRISREDIWPLFHRIGARVVGQWKVLDAAPAASRDADDVYRLVRYASVEHWRATRFQRRLSGNGPAFERDRQALLARSKLEVESSRAYFLEGSLAPGGPYFMPGLSERYELIESGRLPAVTETDIAVRLDLAQPGDELAELRFQRVQKGSFPELVAATQQSIWPWEEKLGARPIGQWKVIYPEEPAEPPLPVESPDFDEIVTMTRYASRRHYQAMAADDAVYLGGNGPDWQSWRAAPERHRKLTISTSVQIVQGYLYAGPPIYFPGLPERYRRVR